MQATKKLNWWNLKKNRCPQCGKDWAFDLTAVDGILAHGCGFKIRESRYKEIVNNQVSADLEAQLEAEREGGENHA